MNIVPENPHPGPILTRMAIEGVPIRAIARIVQVPSAEVRMALDDALDAGTIVQLPRDDWPPQLPRERRAQEYSKAGMDDALLILNVVRLFGVTQQQACLLLVLIKRREVTRKMLHNVIEGRRPHPKVETEPKIVDVVICKLRKRLKSFDLTIETVWSCGYFMPPADRKRALKMLNDFLEQPVTVEEQIGGND